MLWGESVAVLGVSVCVGRIRGGFDVDDANLAVVGRVVYVLCEEHKRSISAGNIAGFPVDDRLLISPVDGEPNAGVSKVCTTSGCRPTRAGPM